jgi:hypothetical protein
MKTTKLLLVTVALAAAIGFSSPAFAGKASGWAFGQGGQSNGTLSPQLGARAGLGGFGAQSGRMGLTQIAAGLVPLMQVLESINAQEPGTQLDTNTVVENGRTIYVVRWQASRGRIIIFRVDAETGQILGRQS